MIPGDVLGRLGRLQHSFRFKVIASIVLVALAIGSTITFAVVVQEARNEIAAAGLQPAPEQAPPPATAPSTEPSNEPPANAVGDAAEVDPALAALRSAEELTARAINQVLARSADPTAFGLAILIALGISLVVVWLGLGLTYLALLILTATVVFPLTVLVPSWTVMGVRLGTAGRFLAAIIALTASFTALMQGLKLALSTRGPITAIARNVVYEAVRMKVSLVFIVMLVFALAALPGLLNESTPLRYRVQSFLQYGTGGAFWIIAVLVLFLSVGTVAFEQRDRVIWQTMTKPVAAWQYLLGKWLGVVGVAAVLLAVSTSGVFLFTEYLRNQPAAGEVSPFVASGPGLAGSNLTEDRFILETQVLAARKVVRPTVPAVSEEALQHVFEERLKRALESDPNVRDTPDLRAGIMDDIDRERLAAFLTLDPYNYQEFIFEGLSEAREKGHLLALRYRIQAGGNDPRDFYRISFGVAGDPPVVREAPLDQTLTLDLSPAAIDADGRLALFVLNGDFARGTPNPTSISFPPDGIELYYTAGSYRANFLRVVFILWMKLAFLAMVGVAAATFLSFPVASLVAFGVFLMAEGSSFLSGSLDYFGGEWGDPEFSYWRFGVRLVAEPVTLLFQFYSRLRPTSSLIEGRLLEWVVVLQTVVIMGVLVALLYGIGVLIFRRRELATYSGQ